MKKIVQQVLRVCCKWETLFFKTLMDLVINKIFQCFYIVCKCLQFFKRKKHFSICYTILKYPEKKKQNSVVKTETYILK